MKKIIAFSLINLCVGILLVGCNVNEEELSESGQKIEVVSKEGTVEEVIIEDEEIVEFVNELRIDEWIPEEIPNDAVVAKIYEMSSIDTVRLSELFKDRDVSLNGQLVIYEDISYATLSTRFINLYYKIPEDVANSLR
ncbi:hypothetical protein [Alkalihalobacillus pseudalcaliphilus]|uniref:hypothetical protein n=1 Tax=Alkalihalobacillus pseudalcaliphilus TaxID=79884 RepID=UPI00064DD7ED|nr:hypothetical protein [Alkalihalobacillus pseudalcaliphilus]KMK74333.1 hypothetical protein AB990_21255 [Alkalihalobacillus pseudalcaliphilus]